MKEKRKTTQTKQGGEQPSAAGGASVATKAKGKAKAKAKADDSPGKVKMDADWEQYVHADEVHDISASVPCVLFLYLVGQCVLGTCVCVSMITHF